MNSISFCDNFTGSDPDWDVEKVKRMLDEIMDYFEEYGYKVVFRYAVFDLNNSGKDMN